MQARAQNTSKIKKKKLRTDFLSIKAKPFGFLVFKFVFLQIQLQFQKLNFLLGLA
jgi:hypothetical protein